MDVLKRNLNFSSTDEMVNFHFFENDFSLHSHLDYFEVVIITQGKGVHTVNGKKYDTEPEDVWLICPETVHSLTSSQDTVIKHLNISIASEFMYTLCNTIDNTFFAQLVNFGSPIKIKLSHQSLKRTFSLIYKFQSMFTQNITKKNGLLNCLAHFLLQEIYIHIPNSTTQIPEWLSEILEKIASTEYLEMKPSEILKTIPYSYSHFERLFKKYMNISFVDYLNINKINYAKELLKTTDTPIITISNKIGMQSLSYFYNVFKKQTGISPSKFKKQFAYNKINKK